jgi:putative DNA primase/helicase
LLSTPGYDRPTELFFAPDPNLVVPAIPDRPTRDEALTALAVIKDLFGEFSFKGDLDHSVAVAALLTALLRGSLSVAPIILVRASTPGTGKSYFVDMVSAIVTGQACPVTTLGGTKEEAEKRIGALLLAGFQIISFDNLTLNLEGPILCQLAERPVVTMRTLGLSDAPKYDNKTMVFATGNNVSFEGDLVRRGLIIDLEALSERPELRNFKRQDAVAFACAERGKYIAAGLTIVRAYFTAGGPTPRDPFGSYRRGR